jgi:hypothetical protein
VVAEEAQDIGADFCDCFTEPANRELENAVESAAIMASGDTIVVSDFESVRLRAPAGKEPRNAPQRTTAQSAGQPLDVIAIPAKATLADAERILISEHLDRAKTKAEAAGHSALACERSIRSSMSSALGGPFGGRMGTGQDRHDNCRVGIVPAKSAIPRTSPTQRFGGKRLACRMRAAQYLPARLR